MPSKNNLHRVKSISEDKEPILSPEKTKAFKKIIKPKVERVNKGFQVERERARQWDLFVAKMKGAEDKKTGPELIDEALDYIFDKYSKP